MRKEFVWTAALVAIVLLYVDRGVATTNGPVLVAEMRGASPSSACCFPSTGPFATKMAFPLLYGFRGVGSGTKAFQIDADGEMGGQFLHSSGAEGFFDLTAANSADFGGIVNVLTNGVDDDICVGDLVSRPSGSWHKSRARRPDRKARRASIQAVCERGATPRGGMPRPGIMSRTTGTGH